MLQPGTPFPDFALANQDGKLTKLSDFAGSWLVVYFYPKDDTPGCTIQGQAFTATKADFDAAGVKVVGVSADDVASHQAFCSKFSFNVELLADPEEKLIKACGLDQTEWKGMFFWARTTFLVGPDGIVRKTYEKADPKASESGLLQEVKELQALQG